MRNWQSVDNEEFRAAFRDWLANNYPPEWRQSSRRPFLRLRGEQLVHWLKKVNAAGWRAPSWPKAHGGLGLDFAKQRIYQEELEHARVARIIDFGEQMLGPIVMEFGAAEQKAHILPRILDCSDVWCQGYSEPNAGSDLASLRTAAVIEDDHFVVNGQKIWTTHAQDSTHIFALVRTGKFERKQEGISFLLIDLSAPGVAVRPIRNIAGEEEYCEVFFTDVIVPRANLLGPLHGGWTVAKALLGHERIFVGSPAMSRAAMALAREALDTFGADSAKQTRFVQLAADLHDYEALYAQMCNVAEADAEIGEGVAMLKICASELQQRLCDLITDISGHHGGVLGESAVGGRIFDIHWQLMMSRPITVFGGANEVQRDILARRVLNLPSH